MNNQSADRLSADGTARWMMTRLCLGGALLLVLLVLLAPVLSGPVQAQEATPSPAGCELPPRTFASIVSLLATPVASASPEAGIPSIGEPLRPQEWAAVQETIHQFVACSNSGEPLRVYALYTDAYLLSLLDRERPLLDQSRYDALATPRPATPEQQIVVTQIDSGRRFPDGRFGVFVTISYPGIPVPKRFFFVLVPGPDRLLIDDIMGELTFSLP